MHEKMCQRRSRSSTTSKYKKKNSQQKSTVGVKCVKGLYTDPGDL